MPIPDDFNYSYVYIGKFGLNFIEIWCLSVCILFSALESSGNFSKASLTAESVTFYEPREKALFTLW